MVVQATRFKSMFDTTTKWFPDFEAKLPSLQGKTVAITGCTSGTGFVVARTAIKRGASNVLLLNRESPRSHRAEDDLKQFAQDNGYDKHTHIETVVCDLQDFDSVRKAAEVIKSRYDAIDVLCNNAGVMALEDKATKDGYDVQMQTNHLSHFLLVRQLFPLFMQAAELRGDARIVHHSSMARKVPSTPLKGEYLEANGGDLGGNGSSMFCGGARWERYHQTKLANAVFTRALADRLEGTNIKAVVAAPGIASTNLHSTTAESGGSGESKFAMYFAQSAEDGAMPILSACFVESTENGDFWEPANRGNTVGPAVKVPFDKLSNNEGYRKLLWEKSEQACGESKVE